MNDLSGSRVLVTGATGFIGGRLAERLVVAEGAQVRALVRNFANAPRLARFPVEMIAGDLASADALDRAADGCEVIFHCAYDGRSDERARRAATAASTRLLLDAALRHRCGRVVFVSTMSVYGNTPAGDLDESAPRRYSGAAYNDSKLDAEKIALEYCAKGLSVAVIQPTIVYGPYGGTWTVKPLVQLRSGRVVLIDGGHGLCNAVYVDDVVTALILAATSAAANGEAFLISAAEPVTWREFYGAYEAMLGTKATVSLTVEEARQLYASTLPKGLLRDALRVLRRGIVRRGPVLRDRLGRARWGGYALAAADRWSLLPVSLPAKESEPPIHVIPPAKIAISAAKTRVRIDKAVNVLGYRPAYDFAHGTAITRQWARWANLV